MDLLEKILAFIKHFSPIISFLFSGFALGVSIWTAFWKKRYTKKHRISNLKVEEASKAIDRFINELLNPIIKRSEKGAIKIYEEKYSETTRQFKLGDQLEICLKISTNKKLKDSFDEFKIEVDKLFNLANPYIPLSRESGFPEQRAEVLAKLAALKDAIFDEIIV